jgi:hypothetical protein
LTNLPSGQSRLPKGHIQLRQIVRDQLWQLDSEYRQTDKQLSATVTEW